MLSLTAVFIKMVPDFKGLKVVVGILIVNEVNLICEKKEERMNTNRNQLTEIYHLDEHIHYTVQFIPYWPICAHTLWTYLLTNICAYTICTYIYYNMCTCTMNLFIDQYVRIYYEPIYWPICAHTLWTYLRMKFIRNLVEWMWSF